MDNFTLRFNGGKFNYRWKPRRSTGYCIIRLLFEQYTEVELHKSKATMNLFKLEELAMADEHTLVSYLRSRIPCKCLDEKYKEVKHVTKIGLCCNPQCHLPDRKCERSDLQKCSRCSRVNYCSSTCQADHWQKHKEYCGECVDRTAKFNSKQ